MLPKPGQPMPFGRYLLVEKIAAGGMAEVFRAVRRGAAGFEKPVAVKRILPVFGDEPDFITLFQDEARIASTLAHANIAQVFEFGVADGAHYIALELVDGLDLARVLARLRAAGQPMPVSTAAFIVAEAARGLAFAHEQRDEHGALLGIVHRDVSPPNILISYAGEVKVTDFGIAKAANKVHKTDTGVIMGKLRYMSPEQIGSEPLDARSDIFSLGVILYELLTGGPIFAGDQSFRLAELIRTAEIPAPSSRNPDVPAALDAIVLRALARRPENRYPRAADLARDLQRFITGTTPGFVPADLGALARSLAPKADELDVAAATEPARRAVMQTEPRTVRPRGALIAGLLLGAVILSSVGMVVVRFLLPGHDPFPPDARRLAPPPPDAPPQLAPPVPTAPFTLLASTSSVERKQLVDAVDRFDVTRRGLPTTDYTAYLTGVDTGLAGLLLDADGQARPLEPLPANVGALVARAGVADAVEATLEAIRRTGELPPLVRSAARRFLDGRNAVEAYETGREPPFAAAALAVWLEPKNPRRLVELAYANDLLGRWCEPPAGGRHFAPPLCERPALIAAIKSTEPNVAEALERWAAATDLTQLGAGQVLWSETAHPDERQLTITLAAEASTATLLAGGMPPATGTRDETGWVFRTPTRVIAPVLAVSGVNGFLRLPPPRFGR